MALSEKEETEIIFFLNTTHPGHDIIMLSIKGDNEKLTKILCYTESVLSPYYHNIPNTS